MERINTFIKMLSKTTRPVKNMTREDGETCITSLKNVSKGGTPFGPTLVFMS